MNLKKPTANQKGLKKLPTTIRNKMGYLKNGSLVTKKKKSKMAAKGGKGVLVVSIGVGKMKSAPKKKKKKTTKSG